jgi:nicotinamide-nucleotide amidase
MERFENYKEVIAEIRKQVKDYLIKNNLKAIVGGISGGVDSGTNFALLYPVCKELGVELIGRYIHIESNKPEEKMRAELIGKCFSTNFESIDLTSTYTEVMSMCEGENIPNETDEQRKIRRGNIKARLRMIYLYNLSQAHRGLVLDNDNLTEHLLGFWTLHGDVGDITPMADLYKVEVWKVCEELANEFEGEDEKKALQLIRNAVCTDGLGIVDEKYNEKAGRVFGSDELQIGCSYEECDEILDQRGFYDKYKKNDELTDIEKNVLERYYRTEYKRNNPFTIDLETFMYAENVKAASIGGSEETCSENQGNNQ